MEGLGLFLFGVRPMFLGVGLMGAMAVEVGTCGWWPIRRWLRFSPFVTILIGGPPAARMAQVADARGRLAGA